LDPPVSGRKKARIQVKKSGKVLKTFKVFQHLEGLDLFKSPSLFEPAILQTIIFAPS
jgi:hypothetical protein